MSEEIRIFPEDVRPRFSYQKRKSASKFNEVVAMNDEWVSALHASVSHVLDALVPLDLDAMVIP